MVKGAAKAGLGNMEMFLVFSSVASKVYNFFLNPPKGTVTFSSMKLHNYTQHYNKRHDANKHDTLHYGTQYNDIKVISTSVENHYNV
jgi:hypothetical protein